MSQHYTLDEPQEAFDWHHHDLFSNPPYDHMTMVYKLANGEFIIEGKQSDFSDASMYADYHQEDSTVWDALEAYEAEYPLLGRPW